jgi:hypothetical protein
MIENIVERSEYPGSPLNESRVQWIDCLKKFDIMLRNLSEFAHTSTRRNATTKHESASTKLDSFANGKSTWGLLGLRMNRVNVSMAHAYALFASAPTLTLF